MKSSMDLFVVLSESYHGHPLHPVYLPANEVMF